MRKQHPVVLAIAAALTFTACTDSNYDLSDIDKTIQVNVNDLTLPINIDVITLKSIIDTKDSDITTVEGEFAIMKSGDINSSTVEIDEILLSKPSLEPSTIEMSTSGLADALNAAGSGKLSLRCNPVNFYYRADAVTSDILTIDEVGTLFTIDITLGFEGLDGIVGAITYEDLVLRLPKGMTVNPAKTDGSYDPSTGLLTVDSRRANGTTLTLHVEALKIDKRSGYDYNYDAHSITFSDGLYIQSGNAVISAADLKGSASSIPSSVTFGTTFDLSQIRVDSFSGTLQYDIKNFSMPEVDLSTLPKALSDPRTVIMLDNPQLYLDINNPAGIYGTTATSGLAITPYRDETPAPTIATAANAINVGATTSASQTFAYCLAPQRPATYLSGYDNPSYVVYPGLGSILGDTNNPGIPSRLDITLVEPRIPLQHVSDYPVGEPLGKFTGRYTFYAPLRLQPGSKVIYHEVFDGWSSEDLEALTITALEVTMKVSTDAPLKVEMTGYPIDSEGNQIGNVAIEGADIDANADNQQVRIYITGEIRDLDGIDFTAFVTPASSTPLLESTTITLTDIRAKASGYYTKEL